MPPVLEASVTPAELDDLERLHGAASNVGDMLAFATAAHIAMPYLITAARRPQGGLCERHDIDPVRDECPCCLAERLQEQIEAVEAVIIAAAAAANEANCRMGLVRRDTELRLRTALTVYRMRARRLDLA